MTKESWRNIGMAKILSTFEINFDLIPIKYKQFHNWIHLIGVTGIGLYLKYVLLIFGPWSAMISYTLWWLWEIGDGFKPWYYTFKWNSSKSWLRNTLKKELLYSDKYSIQDVCFWNLIGAILVIML